MNKGEMKEIVFNRKGKTITLQIDLDLDEDQVLPKTHGKYYVLSEAEYREIQQDRVNLAAELETFKDRKIAGAGCPKHPGAFCLCGLG